MSDNYLPRKQAGTMCKLKWLCIKLHVYILRIDFNTISMGQQVLFFFSQALENVKAFLNSTLSLKEA